MAKVFMGLSSEFTYRNWDLGFNLRANLGNYVFNSLASGNSTTYNYSGKGFLVNYYEAIYKTGFTQINSTEQGASDYFLENASFLKMDNITLVTPSKSSSPTDCRDVSALRCRTCLRLQSIAVWTLKLQQ